LNGCYYDLIICTCNQTVYKTQVSTRSSLIQFDSNSSGVVTDQTWSRHLLFSRLLCELMICCSECHHAVLGYLPLSNQENENIQENESGCSQICIHKCVIFLIANIREDQLGPITFLILLPICNFCWLCFVFFVLEFHFQLCKAKMASLANVLALI